MLDLTPLQQKYVANIYAESDALTAQHNKNIEQLNVRLNSLLSYFVEEAGLPPKQTGYRLSEDRKELIPNE